jgi:hypothetical protein
VVNVSGRYDAQNLTQSRFTLEQEEQLEREGSFTWLNYKAGPEPERPQRRCASPTGNTHLKRRRPYKVTKEAVEHHKRRKLDCVRDIPEHINILSLHGRADGPS